MTLKNGQNIAIIGAGGRGRGLLNSLYQLRNKKNLISVREDGHPGDAYQRYASDPPKWTVDLSAYAPRVSAILDRNSQNQQKALELCKEHGDEPILFTDLDKFLDGANYDAVIVATPNDA